MKQILVLVCCLMLAVALTACGANEKTRSTVAPVPSMETERSESPDVGRETERVIEESGAERQTQQPMPSFEGSPGMEKSENETDLEEREAMQMNVQVGNALFSATLEENAAAEAFVERMQNAPVTIQMSDYSGFEKVGTLGVSLPAENSQITTQPGDIVLYNGNQIVAFYGSNTWSYTRLGRIDDLTGWPEALGSGDVIVTFSVDE